MGQYALGAVVVFALNLLPAFGPPTWAVLLWFELARDLDPVPLVIVGAIAASAGRLVLALLARRFRGRFSAQRLARLEAARDVVTGSRGRTAAGLGVFLVSPLPSAQLFIAAGLLGVALRPLVLAFFLGRLVSYSVYLAAGNAVDASLGGVLESALRSPFGIALQVAMLAALVVLVRVDWAGLLARGQLSAGRGSDRPPSAGSPPAPPRTPPA